MGFMELSEDDRLRALVNGLSSMLNLEADLKAALDIAATFVAVGKLSLESVLHKKEPLTAEESARIRDMPRIWSEFSRHLSSIDTSLVPEIVESYCEHWNGTGYPKGIAGDDIPMGARILAVCYHFNGMISDRLYRPALSAESAAHEIRRMSGVTLDPDVVTVFLGMIETLDQCDLPGYPKVAVGTEPFENALAGPPLDIDTLADDEPDKDAAADAPSPKRPARKAAGKKSRKKKAARKRSK